MNVLRVDHHNDAMILAITVEIPEGCTFQAHGQGRVIGFLIRGPAESPKIRVIHLNYPGVIVEFAVFEAAVSNLPLLPSTFPDITLSSLFCGASASRMKN